MIDPNSETPRGEDRLVGADRVLVVLRVLAERPEGIGLEEMAKAVDSPKPTVHRALAALRRAGFAVQDGRGRYLLGDEFLRLAFTHHEARPDHIRVRPALERLAARFGETAHYAVLDGREVVYRAKVDPPSGPVRLTSTVGGRNPAHSTGVGKLLLAWALPDDAAVAAWARQAPLERLTPRTKASVEELCAELATVRERGCAVDDQENEEGVNCVAVPVFLTSATTPSGAVSVSALAYRTSLASLVEALPEIHAIVKELR
ncbi:IclR family transcriptional regulator [Nonomuraea sp. NPDC059194]|uniref:IclR family transcriptional regulator n=1 Tax=Nonomuraea sp. NPDC059194 TaxID=3346764 RepID=UPI0036B8CC08